MREEIRRLSDTLPDVAWSVSVRDGATALAAVDEQRVLPTASIGKVLLLLEVARRFEVGSLDRREPLRPRTEDLVGDSGLWQHLAEDDLAAESLAVLVAAVSDNLATNVLLHEVGLDSVWAVSQQCGIPRTRLLDRIRDERTDGDPPWPSEGCADDLAGLMSAIAGGEALSVEASRSVADWLALDVDTSMVAGALGLDPLAHGSGPVRLFHKTGADDGVRADVGHAEGPAGRCSYAVLAHWDAGSAALTSEVLQVMREIGELIRERVT